MDNRRKIIVINKKFQYQYSLLIAALTIILVNSYLIGRMLFPGDHPLMLESATVLWLALLEFLLVGGIWYGSLKLSHRIAGPVYVFDREISRVGQGDLTANIKLRDRDMFQPEAQSINDSIAALKGRLEKIKEVAEQLQQTSRDGGDTGPLTEQLATQLAQIKT